MTDKKKAMRAARLRKQRARRVALTLCLIVATMLVSVGGTLAWLTDHTAPVVNTFTPSNIDITLTESENLNLKMVPGSTITKDPKVTVVTGSEACWLFVKIEKSENFDSYMTYTVANGWTALAGVEGVYYREVTAAQVGTEYSVLNDDTVSVKGTVTKAMMDKLSNTDPTPEGKEAYPTLTFTAYAVQKDNVADAAAAWQIANPTPTT